MLDVGQPRRGLDIERWDLVAWKSQDLAPVFLWGTEIRQVLQREWKSSIHTHT